MHCGAPIVRNLRLRGIPSAKMEALPLRLCMLDSASPCLELLEKETGKSGTFAKLNLLRRNLKIRKEYIYGCSDPSSGLAAGDGAQQARLAKHRPLLLQRPLGLVARGEVPAHRLPRVRGGARHLLRRSLEESCSLQTTCKFVNLPLPSARRSLRKR